MKRTYNRISQNISFALLALLTLAACRPTIAQQPGDEPKYEHVIAEAQRLVALFGKKLDGPPDVYTGPGTMNYGQGERRFLRVGWGKENPFRASVEVRMDAVTGRLLHYTDNAALDTLRAQGSSIKAVADTGTQETPPLSREQATAKVEAIATVLPIPPGDWRTYYAQWNDAERTWGVAKQQYLNGYPTARWQDVKLDAQTGTVVEWRANDYSEFVGPTSPTVTRAQAFRNSEAIFQWLNNSGGVCENPRNPVIHWSGMGVGAGLTKLTLGFTWQKGRETFKVEVDAQSGEVIEAGLINTYSQGIEDKRLFNPRIAVAKDLVRYDREQPPLPLIHAVVAGSLMEPTVPSRGAWRFLATTGQNFPVRPMTQTKIQTEFALEPNRRFLLWRGERSNGRTWNRITVPYECGQRLAAWLMETRVAATATAVVAKEAK